MPVSKGIPWIIFAQDYSSKINERLRSGVRLEKRLRGFNPAPGIYGLDFIIVAEAIFLRILRCLQTYIFLMID